MADTSPLAGLLDRASNVFFLAQQLGWTFEKKRGRGGAFYSPDRDEWKQDKPAIDEFCTAVLDLRDLMQTPPDEFAPVADALRKAALAAKGIRDVLQTSEGRMEAAYLKSYPSLFSAAAAGRAAIKQVSDALRPDDPFAFLDKAAAHEESGIDTTPTVPKPPPDFIETAAAAIPNALANVPPNHNGEIELIASHFVTKLQDAKHTLMAAQWAVHEAVQAGRLKTSRVEQVFPMALGGRQVGRRAMFGVPDTRRTEFPEREQSVVPIPEGKPAPFDAFNVIATEALWDWWKILVSEGGPVLSKGAEKINPPGHIPISPLPGAEEESASAPTSTEQLTDESRTLDRDGPDAQASADAAASEAQLDIPAAAYRRGPNSKRDKSQKRNNLIDQAIGAGITDPKKIFEFVKTEDPTLVLSNGREIQIESMMKEHARKRKEPG